mgnify:CR=1 FL=1
MLFGFLPHVGPIELFIVLLWGVLFVWPVWRICEKAGYPGALGLLAILPGFNIGLLLFLAFADWPALRYGTGKPTPTWDRYRDLDL